MSTNSYARISTETLHERLDEPGTEDEIDQLARTSNTMLDRLDRGAQQQRQLVSDASHELRSPLTVMVGESQLAAASGDADRMAAANSLVIEHGERMTKLITDLLDLARTSETGLRRSEVDLDDVLREEARLNSHDIDTSRIEHVRITGDEASLGRLFRNLIDNAVRHADASVAIACSVVGSCAIVILDDDGPGIPLSERQNVFERFARVDASRNRSTGGTGLGLAIAKSICESHQGTIVIGDSPWGGARMVVTLPLADSD